MTVYTPTLDDRQFTPVGAERLPDGRYRLHLVDQSEVVIYAEVDLAHYVDSGPGCEFVAEFNEAFGGPRCPDDSARFAATCGHCS